MDWGKDGTQLLTELACVEEEGWETVEERWNEDDRRAGISRAAREEMEAFLASSPEARARLARQAGVEVRGPSEAVRRAVLKSFEQSAWRHWGWVAAVAASLFLTVSLSYHPQPEPALQIAEAGLSGPSQVRSAVAETSEGQGTAPLDGRFQGRVQLMDITRNYRLDLYRVEDQRLRHTHRVAELAPGGAEFELPARTLGSVPGQYQIVIVADACRRGLTCRSLEGKSLDEIAQRPCRDLRRATVELLPAAATPG